MGADGASDRGVAREAHRYRIASRTVVFDGPQSCLAAFHAGMADDHAPSPPEPVPATGPTLFDGVAPFGGRPRGLRCDAGPDAFWLAVEDVGRFAVARSGHWIVRTDSGRTWDALETVEVVLGPCLALALALAGTWCLHASAVGDRRRVAALLGESGAGKSTLAAALAVQAAGRVGRVADDVLPVTGQPGASAVVALPHFPQLKLPAHDQPGPSFPQRAPLAAAYVLHWAAPTEPIRIEPLPPSAAAAALVRHTVAARLFDGALLAEHLAFCARSAGRLPVRQLFVPERKERLPEVRAAFLADLEMLA